MAENISFSEDLNIKNRASRANLLGQQLDVDIYYK